MFEKTREIELRAGWFMFMAWLVIAIVVGVFVTSPTTTRMSSGEVKETHLSQGDVLIVDGWATIEAFSSDGSYIMAEVSLEREAPLSLIGHKTASSWSTSEDFSTPPQLFKGRTEWIVQAGTVTISVVAREDLGLEWRPHSQSARGKALFLAAGTAVLFATIMLVLFMSDKLSIMFDMIYRFLWREDE